MKDAFLHQIGRHLTDVFKVARAKNLKPDWLARRHWIRMNNLRRTDPNILHQSEVNKQNRGSKRALESGPYRGGSRKFTTWLETMEKESGSMPIISEVVKKLWSKSDGTELGERPAAIIAEYERLIAEEQGDGETPEALSREKMIELWIKACDGESNRKVFALAKDGVALIRSGRVDACFSSRSSNILHAHPAIVPLRDEMKEMREQMKTLQAQNQEIQSQNKALKDLLEKVMKHISSD